VELPPPRRVNSPWMATSKKARQSCAISCAVRLSADTADLKTGDKVLVDVFAAE